MTSQTWFVLKIISSDHPVWWPTDSYMSWHVVQPHEYEGCHGPGLMDGWTTTSHAAHAKRFDTKREAREAARVISARYGLCSIKIRPVKLTIRVGS